MYRDRKQTMTSQTMTMMSSHIYNTFVCCCLLPRRRSRKFDLFQRCLRNVCAYLMRRHLICIFRLSNQLLQTGSQLFQNKIKQIIFYPESIRTLQMKSLELINKVLSWFLFFKRFLNVHDKCSNRKLIYDENNKTFKRFGLFINYSSCR